MLCGEIKAFVRNGNGFEQKGKRGRHPKRCCSFVSKMFWRKSSEKWLLETTEARVLLPTYFLTYSVNIIQLVKFISGHVEPDLQKHHNNINWHALPEWHESPKPAAWPGPEGRGPALPVQLLARPPRSRNKNRPGPDLRGPVQPRTKWADGPGRMGRAVPLCALRSR